MYLKSIDLFGFKTFADRTYLEFQPGISAIVGPNGSGKSNFVDAVRWVLGEQSARQLRGARMDDIIFAGNQTRRPVGLAEVTLTFDNSDGALATPFSEMAITRRAYRTGESEFFLNKSQVRLRDITDLLLGTGLAAELAAIVSQGEIDAILSAKPEQRRELFEGVAGTSRYRVRKREAQRRLEQTAANALRVNDLLSELEKQLPAIELQVRRAKRYQKVSQQLRDLEIVSYLRKTSARREERTRIVAALGQDESAAAASAAKHKELQAALNQARYEEYQASLALDECNATHAKLAAVLQQHAAAHAAAHAKSLELAKTVESLDREVDAAAQTESGADEHLAASLQELSLSRARRDEALALAETAAAEEASATAQWEQAYAELRAAEDARTRAAACQAESNSAAGAADSEWQRLLTASKRLESELTEIDSALARVRTEQVEAEQALGRHSLLVVKSNASIRHSEDELAAARETAETRQNERDRAQAALSRCEAKLSAIQEMQADELAGSAAAKVLCEAGTDSRALGVIGSVAEHIAVAKEHQAAIDALLGAHSGDVIVETSTHAQQAVRILKEAGARRARLIVLAGIKPRGSAQLAPKHSDGVARAAQLVHSEARLRPVIEHLLAGAWVVRSLATALELATQYPDQVFATLDGDVVEANAITTGAGSGALGLRSELVSLQTHHEACAAQASQSERALEEAKALVLELQARLEQAHGRAHGDELNERDQQATVQRYAHEVEALAERKAAIAAALSEAGSEAVRLQQGAAEHRSRADAGQADLDALERGRGEARSLADNFAGALNDLRVRHRSAAANAAAMVERVAQLSDDVEAARAALRRAQQQRKARAAALQQARAELEATAAHAERLTADRAAAQAQMAAAERELEIGRTRRDNRVATAREIEASYDQAQQQGREQSLELERWHIRLAEIDAELSLLQQTFAQNPSSEAECDEIAARYQRYEGEADADVRRLREELARLGNVNLNALEDRTATVERCEFLRAQLRDLESARSGILASIAEMDVESLRQFNLTFEKVAGAFVETFTRLFNGGSARMWVSEAEDPTEAGIEISAQPPGKKMQSLNLLSGGERALTAVALIFATLQVRPSPFYIFDEIDAALDEANIGRFGALLSELAGRSQIIIITHNKATMTLVDRMYGITMGEPGVSNVLSLALERAGARA